MLRRSPAYRRPAEPYGRICPIPRKMARKKCVPILIFMAPTLKALRAEAAGCTRCDLYKRGTQTVFGEGARRARVMLVGEQPGDQEDKLGRPFVGPAGKLLDEALAAAGIDRDDVYVTNAVKHFKWEPRGKRRIHQKPNARRDCRLPAVARGGTRGGAARGHRLRWGRRRRRRCSGVRSR